ncbi:MAG: MarR family transcriptional regulator [Hungatella sp.]
MNRENKNQEYIENMSLTTKLINQRPGRMIQLASLLNRYASRPKYFGDNDYITMIEIGTLVYISAFPGTTNTILCEQFGRTKGAISQLTKKLEDKDYIQHKSNPDDAKSRLFYLTLKGMQLIQKINEKDMNDPNGMLIRMLQICSLEDIQTFFRMVDIYIALLINQISEENDTSSKDIEVLSSKEEISISDPYSN